MDRVVAFQQLGKLGDGLQGSVALCADQYGSFALKQFKHRASFAREFEVLSRLGGLKNVMQLRPTTVDCGDLNLPLQYCANGELFNFMEQCGNMQESLAKIIFSQIVNGIKETHEAGVAHLDIKPENIYVDEHFNIVIGDYGLATMPSCRTTNEVRGTLSYMAPEVIQCCLTGSSYDTLSADVWSLGVLLFIMLTGNNPFGPNNASKKDWYFVQINKGRWDLFWAEHEKYCSPLSPTAKNLIQNCLTVSITDRPTAIDLLNDEFFATNTMSSEEYFVTMQSIKSAMECKMAI